MQMHYHRKRYTLTVGGTSGKLQPFSEAELRLLVLLPDVFGRDIFGKIEPMAGNGWRWVIADSDWKVEGPIHTGSSTHPASALCRALSFVPPVRKPSLETWLAISFSILF